MAVFQLSAFADEASPLLDQQLKALQASGVKCVEMRNVNGASVKDLTLEQAREVRSQLDAAGVRVSSMGSPFGKIKITDDFEPHFQEFLHALDLCHVLGTDTMRIFSFYMPEGEDPALYRDEVLRRMEKMLDAAERENIRLCHENEKGIYGDIGVRCQDLMDSLGDRLGLIFDPANFVQVHDLPADEFPRLEGYLTYMHIKDALMEDGCVVPAGKGDGSVAEILAALSLREGKIVLSVEPHLTAFVGLSALQSEEVRHKYSYPDAFAAFAAAVDALKAILKNLGYHEKEGEGIWTL